MTEITLTPFTNVPYPEVTDEGIERSGSQYLNDLRELGIGQGDYVFRADASGIWLGAKTFNAAPFSVSMAGALTAYSITIIGGTIRYGKTSFSDSTHDGYYIGAEGMYFGAAGDTTVVKHSISTGAITLKGAINTQSGSTIDAQYFIDSTITKTLTMGSASTTGIIQSYGWNGTANGFQIVGGGTPSISLIGGTITGGTIQTATSGNRIVLSGAGNEISFSHDNYSYGSMKTSFGAQSTGIEITTPDGTTINLIDHNTLGSYISFTALNIYAYGTFTPNSITLGGVNRTSWPTSFSGNLSDLTINTNKDWQGYNITNITQLIPGNSTAYLGNSSYYWDYLYVGNIYGAAGTNPIYINNNVDMNSKNLMYVQDCDINGSCDINSFCSVHDKLYMNNTQIKDVAAPTNDNDAATKKWVTDNFQAK